MYANDGGLYTCTRSIVQLLLLIYRTQAKYCNDWLLAVERTNGGGAGARAGEQGSILLALRAERFLDPPAAPGSSYIICGWVRAAGHRRVGTDGDFERHVTHAGDLASAASRQTGDRRHAETPPPRPDGDTTPVPLPPPAPSGARTIMKSAGRGEKK